MKRQLYVGVRIVATVVALALAFQFLQPGSALAAAQITLNPAYGAPNDVIQVSGSGFGNAQLVHVTYSGVTGDVATATTSAAGTFSTTFHVPSSTIGNHTVTATSPAGSASAAFQELGTATQTTLGLSKTVSVNGTGSSVNTTANPGDTLTYALQYANTGAATANNVIVTDTIQPGQTAPTFPAGCSEINSGGTLLVRCVIGTVAPGTGGTILLTTQVQSAFNGTIANYGTATANNAPQVTSNTTTVTVGSGPISSSLQKYVSVNGSGYGTSAFAVSGDQLTYDIRYTNSSASGTAHGVVVTDTLAFGQTLISYPATSSYCTYNSSSRVVTCTLPDVLAGQTQHTYIATEVNGSTGYINNVANASTPGGTISSNTTTVQVGTACTTANPYCNPCTTTNPYCNPCTTTNPYCNPCTTTNPYCNPCTTANPYCNPCTTANPYCAPCTTANPYCAPCTVNTPNCYPCNTAYPNCSNCSTVYSNCYPCTTANPYCYGCNGNGPTCYPCNAQFTSCYPCNTAYPNCAYCTAGNPYCNPCSTTYNNCYGCTSATPSCNPYFFFPGNFTLCGPVTAVSTGAVTVSGVTVTYPSTAPMTNQPPAVGLNECINFTINTSGQVASLTTSPNLTGMGVVCGVYAPGTIAGTIMLSGVPVLTGSGVSYIPSLQNGQYYCFLLTPNGQAYAFLSGVPTAITHGAYHLGAMRPI